MTTMTERATKANARVGAAFDKIGADMSYEVAQLQRSLDEVRGSVASLAARIGDGAVATAACDRRVSWRANSPRISRTVPARVRQCFAAGSRTSPWQAWRSHSSAE